VSDMNNIDFWEAFKVAITVAMIGFGTVSGIGGGVALAAWLIKKIDP
jgi:Na+/glutamate symporter